MSLVLRDAVRGDLAALMALERACYPPGIAFEASTYEAYLAWGRAVNLLAEDDARPVGFGGGVVHEEHGLAEVYTLNVHPDARGAGLGRRLLDALEVRFRFAGADRVSLEVNVGNAPAIALYAGAGYRRAERLDGYYEGTSYEVKDAFRYVKPLR